MGLVPSVVRADALAGREHELCDEGRIEVHVVGRVGHVAVNVSSCATAQRRQSGRYHSPNGRP
jgi:hypothetical protein